MRILIAKNPAQLGENAAAYAAGRIDQAIGEKGAARLLLSTGASQFDTLSALIRTGIDWKRVTMFHLDEYAGLPETHPASFRKYLKERFTGKVPLKEAFFVDGTRENIALLNEKISEAPIDVGLIGMGVNAHIAFNDPPADFQTEEPYIVVNLDDVCKKQQVGEGWFASVDEVPKQAVSMSVRQIMKCRCIVSCVPYQIKANAVRMTIESPLTNMIPATILKQHEDFTLYLDRDSASLISREAAFKGCPTLREYRELEP